MNKCNILTLLCFLLVSISPIQLSAQDVKERDGLWASIGFANYTTYRSFNRQVPPAQFRIKHQNDYHLFSIGSIGESVYLSYLTLEYSTFYLVL